MEDNQSKLPARRTNSVAFSYGGTDVLYDESDLISLTDMWRAQGSCDGKEPWRWAATEQGSGFAADLAKSLNLAKNEVIKTRRGKGVAGTWAHWQIAMAYAKYLSHEFHRFVNEAFRRWSNGETRFSQAQSTAGMEMTTSSLLVQQARMFLAMAERQDELAQVQGDHGRRLAESEARVSELAERCIELEDGHDQLARRATKIEGDFADMVHVFIGTTSFYTLDAWARQRKIFLSSSSSRAENNVCRKICARLGIKPGVHHRVDRRNVYLFPTQVLETWFAGYNGRPPQQLLPFAPI